MNLDAAHTLATYTAGYEQPEGAQAVTGDAPLRNPGMARDQVTWCQVFAVGPPCDIPCAECRARPLTWDQLDRLAPGPDS